MKAQIKMMGAAAIVALAGLTTVAPAMAQGSSAFGLQFGFGNNSYNDDEEGGGNSFFGEPELGMCLTDADIRRSVARQGFTNIYLNVKGRKHVQVKATRDGSIYLLDFNFCTDQIEGAQRLRAAK